MMMQKATWMIVLQQLAPLSERSFNGCVMIQQIAESHRTELQTPAIFYTPAFNEIHVHNNYSMLHDIDIWKSGPKYQ